MATKEQERKALEQIRKIVAGLGEESYIGKAFEGCFELAAENIECDFWNSWKEKYSNVMDKSVEKLTALQDENDVLRKRAEEAERIANSKIESEDRWIAKYKEADALAVKNWNNFREQEDKVGELEQQIIKLKAKLYDMMMAAAE